MIKIVALLIVSYILGFILSDIIYGTYLLSNIFAIDNNQANVIIAYGTCAAVVVALSVALWGGRTLKTLFYNPKLTIFDITPFNQSHTLTVWRLPFKNIGNYVAKDVQVEIVEVIDDKNKKRENFLPIPLQWTHPLDKESRDILPGQTAYLNIFEEIHQGIPSCTSHYFRFGSRYAQKIKDFCFLEPGKSQVKLKLFQQNGQSFEIMINAYWDGNCFFDAGLHGSKSYWEKKN